MNKFLLLSISGTIVLVVGSGEKEEKRKEGKNKNLELAFMIMRLDKGMTKPVERGSAGRGKEG